ncbi:MAG: outer membrane protein assembly factor BamB family protein, partial [Jatrophihabitans sp.]|uniref:outer membrane protein assembly factor BamB family protein n=1 Tax=Jatrophihabitans sp. TaxID=1932789 RepID=UPI003F8083AC
MPPRLTRSGHPRVLRPLAATLAAGAVCATVACSSGSADGSPSHVAAAPGAAAPGTVGAPAAAVRPADWSAYFGGAARTGVSTTMPAFHGKLSVTKRLKLDGSVVGSPIVVGGRIIAATANDSVYAFTLGGRQLWRRHLGTPASQAQVQAAHPGCGNVFPLGITGSPVASNGLVFVSPEYGNPIRHEIVALRVGGGAVAWRRGIDFAGVDRTAMQERGALTVAGGKVWVPFGGLVGDCGNYKGRLVGTPVTGTGRSAVFTVPTDREAGIWTPPGPTVDRSGWLYVAVGNGAERNGRYDLSDSVLRLSTNGYVHDHFSPASWHADNDADKDLGSQGPVIVQNRWIFQAGKSGTAYVLRLGHLGGIGGQVSSATVCRSFGGAAVDGNVVYVPCTDGVRRVTI